MGASDNTPPAALAPQPPPYALRGMGEVLVVLTACNYRLDQVMGPSEHWKIQRRMIDAGLLDEHGEPTQAGTAAAKAFIELREQQLAANRAAEAAKPTGKSP